MAFYIFDFEQIDKTKLTIVGGKGANLGELFKIEGIHVPDGFCISTEAFKRIIDTTAFNHLLDRLSPLKLENKDKLNSNLILKN